MRGPRPTAASDAYRNAADRLDAAIRMLARRHQARAYLGHAQVLDQFADAVEERVIAGQHRNRGEE